MVVVDSRCRTEMRPTDRASNGAVRCLHEALFCGAVASALLTGLIHSGEVYWSGQFFGWEVGLNHSFSRMYNDHLGQALAFCIWSLALVIVGFLLLRALSRAALTARMLRTIAGVVVAAAPPACLWVVTYHGTIDPGWGWGWLRFEALAGVGCALLFACDRWPARGWITATLVTLHFALWIEAYSAAFAHQGSCWLSAPIAGYLSTATWVYYLGRCRREQSSPYGSASPKGGERRSI